METTTVLGTRPSAGGGPGHGAPAGPRPDRPAAPARGGAAEPPLVTSHRLPRARAVDRDEYLLGAAAGRAVTHVGLAGPGGRAAAHRGAWLHARLAGVAGSLVGLDPEPAAVTAARAAGFEAHQVDRGDPGALVQAGVRPAELLIVGDVLGRVDAVGPFLDGLRGLVTADGTMIVTTPNACRLLNAAAALGRRELSHPDNVSWYSWYTLVNVLERHSWWVVGFNTYQAPAGGAGGIVGLVVAAERAVARRFAPFAAHGLIAVCRPAPVPAPA